MKPLHKIILAGLIIFFSASITADAQCKSFAKSICKKELGSYLHDGNYHAAVLVEGEEAELYKTFYSDMDYRIVICGADGLPPIEFSVMDATGKVLYTNKEAGLINVWDFNLESSQQLKILVKVTTFGKNEELPASGCVAIMFGFKTK